MTEEDIKTFLTRSPAMVGVVATSDRDGAPHPVPVWFRYNAGSIRIWTTEKRRWVRNLLNNPQAAFNVQEDAPPYGAVVLKGLAEIQTGTDPWIDAEILAITSRYLGAKAASDYIASWPDLRTIVSITPKQTFAWAQGF